MPVCGHSLECSLLTCTNSLADQRQHKALVLTVLFCSGAHGLTQKLYNWTALNQRVFKKLDFVLAKSECEAVVNCDPGAVERVLKLVKVKLEKYCERQSQHPR